MLRDGVRNEAYRRAISQVVKPGDVVSVTYTESLAFEVVPKGEKPQGVSATAKRTTGGGEVGHQVTSYFKIDSYDPKTHVLWGTGAKGNTRAVRPRNRSWRASS